MPPGMSAAVTCRVREVRPAFSTTSSHVSELSAGRISRFFMRSSTATSPTAASSVWWSARGTSTACGGVFCGVISGNALRTLSSLEDRGAEPSRRDVRVDNVAVALDDLPNTAALQLPRDRRAVEAQHPRNVLTGLGIWRDAAERPHRLLVRIVRGDGEGQIVAEPLPEGAPMAGARAEVLARVEGVPHAEDRGGLRHQLHEPTRALSGHGSMVESRFHPDHSPDEALRHRISRRRLGDLLGVDPVIG